MKLRMSRSGWVGVMASVLVSAGAWAQVAAPVPGTTPATTTPATVAVPVPQAGATAADRAAQQAATAALMSPRKLRGEATSVGEVTTLPSDPLTPEVKRAGGVVADQVIGVVNGDLVLESDVKEEQRFEVFEPFSTPGAFSRDRAIGRLTDRVLILQQAKLQPDQVVTTAEAEAQLQQLRHALPACKNVCETDAGWEKFVSSHGFTMPELVQRWQQRMEILKFIELRFRAGIEITPAQIQTYYEQNMLPQYAKVKATPPKLAVLSDRIQEILLEQQVSSLLADWLTSLKAEGSVRIMRPGEVEP
jgi:peptidyl-prolyl cis-trans isomerase SurA